MAMHRRQILGNIGFEIRQFPCIIQGHIDFIFENLPDKAPNWLESWRPRVERWRQVVRAFSERCKLDTEIEADWENAVAGLCQELADLETALAEAQAWPKDTPEEIGAHTSRIVRVLGGMEQYRQALLRKEYKRLVV